jgi:predicted transcriptional regulator of viral defense system
MVSTITGLSTYEAELLTWLAASGRHVFRLAEVQEHWPAQRPTSAARALSRLERGGWLARIERGLYMLVPLEAGPERLWSQDSMVVGTRLAVPAAIAYWSALRYWNLTEQVPKTVLVQTPCRKTSATVTVGSIVYRIVHITELRFYGLITAKSSDLEFRVTDLEKTVIDALDRPDLCGGIGHVVWAIVEAGPRLDWDRLGSYLFRFGSGAVTKRLGYLLETAELDFPGRTARLQEWQSSLSKGIANLDPESPGQGVVRRRWRIRDNIGLAARWKGG